jgi:hypothetical protein
MARHTIDSAGVAEVERLVTEHQIACDWSRTGSIHAAADHKNFVAINKHQQCFPEFVTVITWIDLLPVSYDQ